MTTLVVSERRIRRTIRQKRKTTIESKPLRVPHHRLEEMNEHRRKYPSLNPLPQQVALRMISGYARSKKFLLGTRLHPLTIKVHIK